MLPISREVLLKELETASDYIAKWIARVHEGVPGIDMPPAGNSEEQFDSFVRELVGELRIVSGKCDTLAEVVSEVLLSS